MNKIFAAANSASVLQNDGVLSRYRQIMDSSMISQQDNAPVHTSRQLMHFKNDENVERLDWPAYSLDFSMIHKGWKILACKVSDDAWQSQMVLKLRNTVTLAWKVLDQTVLINLWTLFR
ncbi:hypothetical protein FVE85_7786 [Porphyridium purpureum]|uniref:Transposable element Tc3 transposase n=1 Tax=Porphyridium purpureum TaxID=35688 RepID=A0A5J4YJP7_PORPP|nr:hypothetical protein FVE85_7786 [Porphyridium purpureum]|eukprot:POR1973..scf210_14